MKKYLVYWLLMILSALSLLGYILVGNYVFEMNPTGETFDVYNGNLQITPYVYVEPVTGVLGVAVQAAGVFLYCVSFGILARYCKLNLSNVNKHISVAFFAVCYIAACGFLFLNNFTILNISDSYAIKEIWANAVNFLVCVSAAIFGFCAMYFFKNKDNHIIYSGK